MEYNVPLGARIAVLCGGMSSEREVSLRSGKNVLAALKRLGYETGTGCLVGLPNQTTESLANDILFFNVNIFC